MTEFAAVTIIIAAGIVTYICCMRSENRDDERNDDE